MPQITVPNEEAMKALGRDLAPILREGDCVKLVGDLGAGKTTLARAIIRARAGAEIDVPSPSFSIVETYQFDTPVHHVDFYRLEDASEVRELGIEDMADYGIMLVEWPEIAEGFLPKACLTLRISHREGDARIIELEGDASWEARLAGFLGGHKG
ncbi:tRNA (adenosine(37)-N6)-threonylcarbamoyltransferase complex ATPase subunit type 1 TsaE [Parvularcula sp. ZS-1/3]|uniref:tRNA threonylcarbamoyladenosine biosynthesis protein TsaE n=1 Tax=Parvularcula mediterranea TaxID=2732508 RepID=A0A7Y3RMP0_9PROT|nr:tRNA (adenosine(37)-N6)-threonylcarbamoyltransferase complex ATPase subunit type 1 TsaE [Parvularcula mediterranea]NNU16092.1 tRNA (adenosine(37)-N6)-threonylcarbamoyltransferase complex ATPase subunit type 1 TsaE [Parvularcula mediterranea]